VPVLATNVGGPPEIIGKGREDYVLPPGESATWARAVRRVVEGPEEGRELGRAGRERVAEAFAVEEHVEAVLAIYARALERMARGRREPEPARAGGGR
jgi:glycosyltransferase involved in cell wall biosynthesis